MRGNTFNKATVLTLLFLALAGQMLVCCCSRPDIQITRIPERIVSLAPSITETLFALGLGEKVVGVTRFCNYPEQAKKIEKIGGYADPNLEKIITLNPNLVVLLDAHEKQRVFLKRFGIRTLSLSNQSCADICTSFFYIGRACGAVEKADSLIRYFKLKLNNHKPAATKQKVLLCVGRDSPGGGSVQSVFIAGTGTFYNDIINASGAVNVFSDSFPSYPKLSREGIISLSPDVIIDIAPAMASVTCKELIADWKNVPMVPAITSGRVHCLAADYATVPGPRILLLLRDIRSILDDTTVLGSTAQTPGEL